MHAYQATGSSRLFLGERRVAGSSLLVPPSRWSFHCEQCMSVEQLVPPRLYLGEHYMSTSDPLVIPLRAVHVCRVAGSSLLVPPSRWSFHCEQCMSVESLVHPRLFLGERCMCTSEPLVIPLQTMHVCQTAGSPRLYLSERCMCTSNPLVISLQAMHVCRAAGSSLLVP